LRMEQSGIYLTGSFFENGTAEAASSSEEHAALTGQWQGGKLSLSGSVPQTSCPPDTQLAIVGSVDKTSLKGTLTFDANPPIDFTAERQVKQPQNAQH
ncbi:MAG TPA: hypothetical protein V6D03_09695, partial [Candidatus Caenarcaniphilales bacterium]